MPTTVLLIRHPESAWNRRGIYQGRRDIPLSPLGRIQAELVARRLNRERIDRVVTSPLGRARTLAAAIAHHHGLEPETDDRVTEISHGTWEGLSRQDVERAEPELYRRWQDRPHEVRFEGGESLLDVRERSLPLVEELLGRPGDRIEVLVTHDTVARLVVAAAVGQGVEGFSTVSLENAGITTLHGPRLLGSLQHVNDVEHLGRHRVNLEGQAL